MNLSSLSGNVQNIILFNYGMFMKLLFLAIMFGSSIYYLFYHKPNVEKPTALWSIFIGRVIFSAFSFFILILSPLMLITLDPSYAFNDFFMIYSTIYLVLLSLLFFISIIDFSYWGIRYILKIGGLDKNSESYSKFQRWVDVYLKK